MKHIFLRLRFFCSLSRQPTIGTLYLLSWGKYIFTYKIQYFLLNKKTVIFKINQQKIYFLKFDPLSFKSYLMRLAPQTLNKITFLRKYIVQYNIYSISKITFFSNLIMVSFQSLSDSGAISQLQS